MEIIGKYIKITFLVGAALVVASKPTYAYLDPGTGSYIIQILIATLAGSAYIIATSWQRIKTFFSNLLSKLSKNKNGKGK